MCKFPRRRGDARDLNLITGSKYLYLTISSDVVLHPLQTQKCTFLNSKLTSLDHCHELFPKEPMRVERANRYLSRVTFYIHDVSRTAGLTKITLCVWKAFQSA